jgi:hypothetical protein
MSGALGIGHWALGIGHWALGIDQKKLQQEGAGKKILSHAPSPCPIIELQTGYFAVDTSSGLYPGVRLPVRRSSNA